MAGHISASTFKRLPSTIREMDERSRMVYIYLRLRKPKEEIARLTGLSIELTKEAVSRVRHKLAGAGQLDLIEDPQILSIHSGDPEKDDIPVVSTGIGADEEALLNEFRRILQETISNLSQDQSLLLRLKYRHNMPVKDIAGFCRKAGINPIPEKADEEVKEQDIFYALKKTLKEVLAGLGERYKEEVSPGMENLKYILENIGF